MSDKISEIYDIYVCQICDILQIPIPEISYDTSKFISPTMMALCDGKSIYFKKPTGINYDVFFAIAHELRHVWQIQTDEEYYFSTYKTVEEIGSIEEYNKQIAELDANAFAGIIMESTFKVKPLFNGLSEEIKKLIYEQYEKVAKTLDV